MIVRDADGLDIRYVVAHMREWNKRELFAGRYDKPDTAGLEQLIAQMKLAQSLAIKAVALHAADDFWPAALVSAYRATPRTAIVGMVMTDKWPAIGKAAWRYLKRTFIPDYLVPNVDVAETRVMAGGPSLEWLERLGFRRPCGLPVPRGNAGEHFYDLIWRNPTTIDRLTENFAMRPTIDAAAAPLRSGRLHEPTSKGVAP